MALTYPEVGATAGELPAGYRLLRRRVRLGEGQEVFSRSVAALRCWQVHRGAGLAVYASQVSAQPGAVVALLLGRAGIGLYAPCRVVYVVDQPTRQGFAYGTLPGHPEVGEEAFVVSWLADGGVDFWIRGFSRPGGALTRIAGPVGHWVQDRLTNRYLSAAERIAHDQPPGGPSR